MQQRRLRPGDVLDDYCPRERRITDHAIVAMIDDNIKQTRCVACDVEHEYKQGRVPPQRRKKTPALFTQVLDGLQGPTRPPHLPNTPDEEPDATADAEIASVAVPAPDSIAVGAPVPVAAPIAAVSERAPSRGGTNGGPATNGDGDRQIAAAPAPVNDEHLQDADADAFVPREDGPVRRPLIRATLPRPEGQPVQPTRAMPEFTIRQPGSNGRANRHGGRRRGPHQPQGHIGPMRSGRGANGQRSDGGRGQGGQGGHGGSQGRHGGQGGHGGHGGPNGNRGGGGSRRGGKKR